MVCEKNGDVEHDFLKDPLRLFVEGDCLRARGTTLGADNGIAVAMMLSLLDGEIPSHPAFECLFTVSEETGMEGVNGFDYSRIKATRLVNMDSEELGCVTAGCAGGVRSDLSIAYTEEPFSGSAVSLQISGLVGGHSGEHINRGRANANKLMGRLLSVLLATTDARIVWLEGGSKTNAIPRECRVTLAVADVDAASELLLSEAERIAGELSIEDRGFSVTVSDCEPEPTMLSRADTLHIATVLSSAANGVLAMHRDIAGLVEYSRNLGVVSTEDRRVTFAFSTRSSMESRLDASTRELDLLARTVGATAVHHGRYPGWNYAPDSPLREAYCRAYREVTGKDARIDVIHAGLECGVIGFKIPGIDAISIGPTMYNIHSPNEALNLSDTEVFWKVLLKLIELL